jgi:AcrR family transcriptional regulator
LAREEQKVRSDSVRQAILDTALQIGLEEGFEAISVRKIINKMKYSTGIVYHHFKDKQEIIDAIEASETEKFYGVISQLVNTSEDTVSNMFTVFRRSMQLAFDEPEKYNLIVLHKYSRHKPSASPWVTHISENLKREMEAGRVRLMDANKAAFSIWSSFLGFNLMISRMEALTIEQAEAMFNCQVEIILKGVINK